MTNSQLDIIQLSIIASGLLLAFGAYTNTKPTYQMRNPHMSPVRIDTDSDFSTPPGEESRSFDTSNDWNAGIEACCSYLQSRWPPGVNDDLAASLRKFKRKA